ncbi:MAG: hypothetical protein CBE14_002720 [Rickettsiales bacterium TMED254]|nr:MAG: hypothetical protein CBE14_002720 [Rickettsiales bacterium TMED254]|tara:strand:+ start:233 stop:1105 length:873 start_codon:yes stop_codon:yes gene_type:complete
MRKKYLNNRDLLKEIHRSKNSYCSYVDDEANVFDIILPSIEKINIRTVAQAKRERADRLAKNAYTEAVERGEKVKQAQFAVDWKKIQKTDLVFRIVTFDHVPLEPGRKRSPKTVADHHERCNFPPFQHFKFDDKDNLICVGKSHWVGGMANGHFSKDHGKINNNLAKMFMKLVERYATRSNWRGYTYNDEMKSTALLQLAQIGLQFDESKSANPFAYYTAAITNSFTRVLNLEKKNQIIRDDILEDAGLNPSFTRQTENDIASGKLDFNKGNSEVRTPPKSEWKKIVDKA